MKQTVRNKTIILLLVMAMVLLAVPVAADSSVVFEDDFEFDTGGWYGGLTAIPNWTITSGSVDIIGEGTPWLWFPGNGHLLDMEGNSNAVIQSPLLNLTPGAYELSFEIGNTTTASGNSLDVQLGTVYNENFSTPPPRPESLTLVTRQIVVTAAEDATLTFTQLGPNDFQGTALDDVLLVKLDATSKDECKDGGWEAYGFSNQGQCVRYIETGKDSR